MYVNYRLFKTRVSTQPISIFNIEILLRKTFHPPDSCPSPGLRRALASSAPQSPANTESLAADDVDDAGVQSRILPRPKRVPTSLPLPPPAPLCRCHPRFAGGQCQ